MNIINTWKVRCGEMYAQAYFNQNFTVWGLTPDDPNPSGDGFLVRLVNLGDGHVAFQCLGASSGNPDAYASARVGDNDGQVQFQSPNGTWITQPEGDETFDIIPADDGSFAIHSSSYNCYVSITGPDGAAQGCYPLCANQDDLAQAARFQAFGIQRPAALDFLELCHNASGLSFAGADISRMNLTGYALTNCDMTQVAGLEDCVLDGAHMQHANLSGLHLATVSMSGTDLTGATLIGTDFTSVKPWSKTPILDGANLTKAVLPPSLAGASMQGATLTGVNLKGVNLAGADLTNADLRGAIVAGGVLTGAKLTGAKLQALDLQGVQITHADLTGAHLAGCKLPGVDLTGTILAGTDFTGVDLTTTTMPSPLTRSTDPSAPTIFANAKLPYSAVGLDWSYLDLTDTEIVGQPANLTGLNAEHAILTGHSFESCTLNAANFSSANLTDAVFESAILHHAPVFAGATLAGAVFTLAKLDAANFVGAALGGVAGSHATVFSFAYVSNCDFTGANMYNVGFAGATLMGDNKLSGSSDLQESDFSNAYLANADFTGASLQGAKFDGAFMVECILTNAKLSPTPKGAVSASLTSACLQAANFQGTDLSSADLTNAVIKDQSGKISMQYYDANGNLTKPYALPYPAGSLPDATSFSASTVCPNGAPYSTNVDKKLSIPQMMIAPNPPTKWSPGNRQVGR